MANLKDTCAIVGVGETKFGKVPGVTGVQFCLESCKKAIEDAGLTNADVDGVLTQQPYGDPTFMYSTWLGQYLGIKLRYSTDMNLGGATPAAMVQSAVMAINAGLCNTVVCVFGEDGRSRMTNPHHGNQRMGGEDFETPFGFPVPGIGYSMAARRHMHEYGTKSEHFGAIAIACRKHAALNENAQQKAPMTMEDYFSSPMFWDPFRLFDICQVTDGGAAVVVTSAQRAKNLRHPPVYISGMGQFHPHRFIAQAPSMTEVGSKISGETAFKMAGMTVKDIDAAEIYDCFTYTVLVQIEDYGFCKKGEGGPFVEGGRIELGGQLPVNTHGGLLSQGHIDGMNHITEAVKQLRGQCGPRQVKGAEVILVTGNGGVLNTHATLILRR